ncbi:hypothetical protein HMPREF0731_0616 [Pseudoroseomonas cervicalis ATCC 49957]|uniref:Uncharacterized protein n=1 Tax=Pseudoroseomonas cervicalis ATCC 49957 TaxID=525371 RepID=D5RHQ6_9PROT|nr:hypothetical protein HMPREF0731_0616 [Pseudoroseomonas cervicalis ATCC 49957]
MGRVASFVSGAHAREITPHPRCWRENTRIKTKSWRSLPA